MNSYGTVLMYYAFLAIIIGLLVMLLWNWALVPALPMFKPIGWLQGICLFVLSNILFKDYNTTTTVKK